MQDFLNCVAQDDFDGAKKIIEAYMYPENNFIKLFKERKYIYAELLLSFVDVDSIQEELEELYLERIKDNDKEGMVLLDKLAPGYDFYMHLAHKCGTLGLDLDQCNISSTHKIYYCQGVIEADNVELFAKYNLDLYNEKVIVVGSSALKIMDHLGYNNIEEYYSIAIVQRKDVVLKHLIGRFPREAGKVFNTDLLTNALSTEQMQLCLNCGYTITKETLQTLKYRKSKLYEYLQEQV